MRGPRISVSMVSIFLTQLFLSLVLVGCSPSEHDAIVASIGKDVITLREYEKLYDKNNTGREDAAKLSQDDREKFLDLLVNYRLKLLDAYHDGLDKRPEVIAELAQYRGNLCSTFLLDREVVNPGVRNLYDQRKDEVRAQHILISLKPNAPAQDSVAAYTKASMILGLIRQGASFDSLAFVYSDDPSAKSTKGDLYYFTFGTMVPVFENAAFSMKVGEVSSAPVRSQYGLHIIKITDRKIAEGEIRCSHIMIQFRNPRPAPADTIAAYTRILAIKDSLAHGADFAELAKRNSTDPGSAPKGGDLGWFSRRHWVLPFDEAAFQLKLNELSRIIRTPYGYHIIKCTGIQPRKSFEESREEMKQLYQKTRFQDDYQNYVGGLKRAFQFKRNDLTIEEFLSACDTTKTTRDSGWAAGVTPEFGRQPMFVIQNRSVSVDSVVSIISARTDIFNSPAKRAPLVSTLDKLAEILIFAARSESLEKENPEFNAILREYREGILLYQVEQEKVWNRIAPTDSLLHMYFIAHRDHFAFPDRVNITNIHASGNAVATDIVRQLKAGKTMEEIAYSDSVRMSAPLRYQISFKGKSSALSAAARKDLTLIAAEAASDSSIRIQITTHPDTSQAKADQEHLAGNRSGQIATFLSKSHGVPTTHMTTAVRPLAPVSAKAAIRSEQSSTVDVEIHGRLGLLRGKLESTLLPANTDELSKAVDTLSVGGLCSPFSHMGGWVIVRLNGRDASHLKTFEEAGAEVSSAFQESESHRLEQQWLDGLKNQYPVLEHKEILKGAFAPPEP